MPETLATPLKIYENVPIRPNRPIMNKAYCDPVVYQLDQIATEDTPLKILMKMNQSDQIGL